jgi:hypothetical protein
MKNEHIEARVRDGLSRIAQRAPSHVEVWRQLENSRSAVLAGAESGKPSGWRAHRSIITTTVAAAAVVAATLIGVNSLWTNSTPGGGEDRVAPSRDVNEGVPSMQNPVEVGRGRAVVSVPDHWARNAVHCGVATRDTVVFETSLSRACFLTPTEHSTVTIGPATGHDPGNMKIRVIDGSQVYVSDPELVGGFTVVKILVPSEDAYMLIWSREVDLVTEIADSFRLLPPTATTVPDIYQGATGGTPGLSDAPGPDEVRARLQQAGLAVRFRFDGAATAEHWSALHADVEPGSVVDAGTAVNVTYSVGTKGP